MWSQLWPPARPCRTPGQALSAPSPLCLKHNLCHLYGSPHVPLGLSWAAPCHRGQGPCRLRLPPLVASALGGLSCLCSCHLQPTSTSAEPLAPTLPGSRTWVLGPQSPGQEEAGQALPWQDMGTRSPRGQPSPALGEGTPEQVDRCPQGCGRIHVREPRQERSWVGQPWILGAE